MVTHTIAPKLSEERTGGLLDIKSSHVLFPSAHSLLLSICFVLQNNVWKAHWVTHASSSHPRQDLREEALFYFSYTKSIQTIAVCCCTDATSTALHAQIRSTYLLHFCQKPSPCMPCTLLRLLPDAYDACRTNTLLGPQPSRLSVGSAAVPSHLQVAVQAEQLRIWNLDELGIPIF